MRETFGNWPFLLFTCWSEYNYRHALQLSKVLSCLILHLLAFRFLTITFLTFFRFYSIAEFYSLINSTSLECGDYALSNEIKIISIF